MNAHRLPRHNSFFIFLILTLLLLYSCSNGPSEEIANEVVVQEQGEPVVQEQQEDLEVIEVLPSILCSAEELEPPNKTWPHPLDVVWSTEMESLLPAEFFQWSPISCIPDKFKVYFTDDPTWGTSRLGQTDGQTAWPDPEAAYPQVPLEPATEYWWKVRAWADGVEGPDSSIWVFYTGPKCSVNANLPAPELLQPLNEQTITSPSTMLRFKPGQPECVATFYFVNLQTSPDFSGSNLAGMQAHHTYRHLEDLQDCTTYYWKVAASLSPFPSQKGPYSVAYSFTTDFDNDCLRTFTPQVTAVRDLACYRGPNVNDYPILGYLLQGETAEVVAQSLDMNWWYIRNPDGPENCAVPKDRTESVGGAEDTPLWNNPDIEPGPGEGSGGEGGACSRYTTQQACEAAGCTWDQPTPRSVGTCVSP
jgi:hypothetical protein